MKRVLVSACTVLLAAGFLSGCSNPGLAHDCESGQLATGCNDGDSQREIPQDITVSLTPAEAKTEPKLVSIREHMKENITAGGSLEGSFINDSGEEYTVKAYSDGTRYYAITTMRDEEFLEAGTSGRHCTVDRPKGSQEIPPASAWKCGFGDGESNVYGVLAGYAYYMYEPTGLAEGGLSGTKASTVKMTSNAGNDTVILEGTYGSNTLTVTYQETGDSIILSDTTGRPDTSISYDSKQPSTGYPELPAE